MAECQSEGGEIMPISLLLALPLRIFRLSYGPAQALTLISFPSFRPFVVHLPVLGFFLRRGGHKIPTLHPSLHL